MKRKRRVPPKKAVGKKKKPAPEVPVNADAEVFLNFVEQNVDKNGNKGVCQFNAAKEFSSSLSPSSSSRDGGRSFHPAQDSVSSDEPAINNHGRRRLPLVKGTNNTPIIVNPRYNKVELQACLMVIKKIMEMDEAVSFCSPVDPITQGIPDYFSVINTPMDFGTIRSNLENDVKYMNADDVYKDVEYIWENCNKYNKKGDYIVYLMKRVKKKFLKYWSEVGLDIEMQRRRHYERPVFDNMVNSYQKQRQPSYGQPSTSLMPQYDYSQFRAEVVSSRRGHSYMEQERLELPPTHFQQQQPQISSRYMWQPHQTASQSQPQPNGYVSRSSMIGKYGSSSHYQQDQPNLPRGSVVPTQPSHPAASADVSSPVGGRSRERRYMTRSSAGTREGVQVPQQRSEMGQEQPAEKKRRFRGPTRRHLMEDLPEGHRIHVPINERGQPVGHEAAKLSSYLGCLARDGNLAPLNYLTWRAMPKENKENMWQLVQTKFDVDPLCKKWFLESLGHKWRKWKGKLKADHYTPHSTDEERLRDRDKRVSPDQWAALVAHWSSEKAQIIAMKNKANSAKAINTHASGSKSFARIQEEERAKRGGKELSRSELYIVTRTRKNGMPVDNRAAERIEKIRELENRKEQSSGASSDGNQVDTFCKVMGKETGTHVRMFGFGGPTICELYGRKSRSSSSILREEVLEAKKSANEMMTKMEAMEHKYSSLESQMAQMNSNMQILIGKMGGNGTVSNQVPPEDSRSQSSSSSRAFEVEDEEDE